MVASADVLHRYSCRMGGIASWVDGQTTPIERATLRSVLGRASADIGARPIIVALRCENAELTVVVGDPSGTTLVYFPPDYQDAQAGSLVSVGDADAADSDRWGPPLVADFFTHYTEYPRWSVIPHSAVEQALGEFLERPFEAPRSITWQPD
jgi:hypothetical protein